MQGPCVSSSEYILRLRMCRLCLLLLSCSRALSLPPCPVGPPDGNTLEPPATLARAAPLHTRRRRAMRLLTPPTGHSSSRPFLPPPLPLLSAAAAAPHPSLSKSSPPAPRPRLGDDGASIPYIAAIASCGATRHIRPARSVRPKPETAAVKRQAATTQLGPLQPSQPTPAELTDRERARRFARASVFAAFSAFPSVPSSPPVPPLSAMSISLRQNFVFPCCAALCRIVPRCAALC